MFIIIINDFAAWPLTTYTYKHVQKTKIVCIAAGMLVRTISILVLKLI